MIAERTGCTTVADFRPRDLAAGGEGAPLAPFFHFALLADPAESRARAEPRRDRERHLAARPAAAPDDVIAFDVGPANALLDGVVRRRDGRARAHGPRRRARAPRGRVDAALLARLLDDDYLRRPPPKCTGRERYGAARRRRSSRESRAAGRSLDDLLATLIAFTAEAVGAAVARAPARARAAGRSRACSSAAAARATPRSCAALGRALPGAAVEPMDAQGVPADAAEAMAFSLIGRNALLGVPEPPAALHRRARARACSARSSRAAPGQIFTTTPSSAISKPRVRRVAHLARRGG